MSREKQGVPAEVDGIREQLQEWRGKRRHGQRIPEELWAAAVAAARRHGLNRVSQTLKLDYYQLKRRCGQKGEAASEGVFVELEAAKAEGARCLVELEKGNGAKLRVCVDDAAAVDWCRVKEAFLGA
jgi:hypothetical protein